MNRHMILFLNPYQELVTLPRASGADGTMYCSERGSSPTRIEAWFRRVQEGSGHREPSLYCWILEILDCDPKGRRALLRIPSTVGRSVCLCWAPSQPKGPTGPPWDPPC